MHKTFTVIQYHVGFFVKCVTEVTYRKIEEQTFSALFKDFICQRKMTHVSSGS